MNTTAADLDALYARLPELECKGLCGHSCSVHVHPGPAELRRIEQAGVDITAPTADGSCPALSKTLVATGACRVHAIRPMICRLWGMAASMVCQFGCVPAGGHLSDDQAMDFLLASSGDRPAERELLAKIAADPTARTLLAGLMRGNQSVREGLALRIRHLLER